MQNQDDIYNEITKLTRDTEDTVEWIKAAPEGTLNEVATKEALESIAKTSRDIMGLWLWSYTSDSEFLLEQKVMEDLKTVYTA